MEGGGVETLPVVLSTCPLVVLFCAEPTVLAAARCNRRASCVERRVPPFGAVDGMEGMKEPSSASHPRRWYGCEDEEGLAGWYTVNAAVLCWLLRACW